MPRYIGITRDEAENLVDIIEKRDRTVFGDVRLDWLADEIRELFGMTKGGMLHMYDLHRKRCKQCEEAHNSTFEKREHCAVGKKLIAQLKQNVELLGNVPSGELSE